MPKGWKAQDHFDELHPIGRNPFYRNKQMVVCGMKPIDRDRGINLLKPTQGKTLLLEYVV